MFVLEILVTVWVVVAHHFHIFRKSFEKLVNNWVWPSDMKIRALYRVKVYRMYQYFGYNTVEDISNQTSLTINSRQNSAKFRLLHFFTNVLLKLAIFSAARNIAVHIVYRFKVSIVQYHLGMTSRGRYYTHDIFISSHGSQVIIICNKFQLEQFN